MMRNNGFAARHLPLCAFSMRDLLHASTQHRHWGDWGSACTRVPGSQCMVSEGAVATLHQSSWGLDLTLFVHCAMVCCVPAGTLTFSLVAAARTTCWTVVGRHWQQQMRKPLPQQLQSLTLSHGLTRGRLTCCCG